MIVRNGQVILDKTPTAEVVESGNVNPVSSNAVNEALKPLTHYVYSSQHGMKATYTIINKLVTVHVYGDISSQLSTWTSFFTLPKPKRSGNIIFRINNIADSYNVNMYILSASGTLQNGNAIPPDYYFGSVTYEAE